MSAFRTEKVYIVEYYELPTGPLREAIQDDWRFGNDRYFDACLNSDTLEEIKGYYEKDIETGEITRETSIEEWVKDTDLSFDLAFFQSLPEPEKFNRKDYDNILVSSWW